MGFNSAFKGLIMYHHKRGVPSMLISVKGTSKNQLELSQQSTEYAPVISYCFC